MGFIGLDRLGLDFGWLRFWRFERDLIGLFRLGLDLGWLDLDKRYLGEIELGMLSLE